MSFWDNVQDFGEAVAAGDADGAAESAGEAAEDANEALADGVNAAGDAASDATGGAVDVNVDEDGVSGQVGAISGDLDTDGSDGSVSAGAGVEFGGGVGAFARGSADTDTSDGTAGIESEVGIHAMGHEAAVGADVGNSDQPRGQVGVDLGGRIDSHEAGVTINADMDSEQAGIDGGGYYENSDGRIEGGLTVNADKSFGQVGVDAGGFIEAFDEDGDQTVRQETGVTANLDSSGGTGRGGVKGNIDVGVFTELDTGNPIYDARGETGLTVGSSADGHQSEIGVGAYGELIMDGSEENYRGEGQIGFAITELSEDDTGKGFGVGVGNGGSMTIDRDGEHESMGGGFYLGASVDEDGVVIGGVGGANSPSQAVGRDSDEDDRTSAQVGVRLGVDDGRIYGGVVLDSAGDKDIEAGVWVGTDEQGNIGAGTYERTETGQDLDFGDEERGPIRIQGDGIDMTGDERERDADPVSDEVVVDSSRRGEAAERESADGAISKDADARGIEARRLRAGKAMRADDPDQTDASSATHEASADLSEIARFGTSPESAKGVDRDGGIDTDSPEGPDVWGDFADDYETGQTEADLGADVDYGASVDDTASKFSITEQDTLTGQYEQDYTEVIADQVDAADLGEEFMDT